MLVAVAVVLPTEVLAGHTPQALRDWISGDPDEQAVDSLDFILTLSLSRDQAREILPHLEQACQLHTDYYAALAEIQPLEIQAYRAFLEEDRLNQGFTPEVETRTVQIHRRAKVAREEVVKKLNALAGAVWLLLTPDQRRVAEAYAPKREAVFDAFGNPDERNKAARRAARRAQRGPSGSRPRDPELDDARRELEEISRATHERPDVVARHLLTPAAAEALHDLAGARPAQVVHEAVGSRRYGTPEYPRAQCRRDQDDLRALRKEINYWNLANGMHFSREQIEQLVYLAEEAEQLRRAQRQAKPGDRWPAEDFRGEVVRLELAAESVLRLGQLEVMRTYKPCLLPPKNLKDPVRVGQAANTNRLAKWLARARERPDQAVKRMINRLLEGEAAHLGPMDQAVLEQRRDLLCKTVREAAEMSEVEFALSRDELVDAIRSTPRKDELLADLEAMQRERLTPGRTSRFLLNDGFAAVLEIRHEQLSRGGAR